MKLINIVEKILFSIVISCILNSCNSKNNENSIDGSLSSFHSIEEENEDEEFTTSNSTSEIDQENSDCNFEDGNYTAIVDYNNPETSYSATYTLDVEVEDCQVVQINFPNDGYLDEDHISYADIDEDGRATVYGEEGKTYEIQINN